MDELLKQRIMRRLENLTEDKAYQALDYIDFLESRFGDRSGPSTIEKIADRVEDTMRAGRVSVSAIKGTRDVIDAAGRVMQGIADVSRNVIDELQAPLTSSEKQESAKENAAVQKNDADKPKGDTDHVESA